MFVKDSHLLCKMTFAQVAFISLCLMLELLASQPNKTSPTKGNCHRNSHKPKINKKIAEGESPTAQQISYVGRMWYQLASYTELPPNEGCAGVFLSVSDPSTCSFNPVPMKYYFVTAAHCFNKAVGSKGIKMFGMRKNSQFYSLGAGVVRIDYEGDQRSQPARTGELRSIRLELALRSELVRIPVRFALGEEQVSKPNLDIATVELSSNEYNRIKQNGGDFIPWGSAYTTSMGSNELCYLNGIGGPSNILEGFKMTRVKEVATIICQKKFGIAEFITDFVCLQSDKPFQKVVERGDSGGPIFCGGESGYLTTNVVGMSDSQPFVLAAPSTHTIRSLITAAFYDKQIYYYHAADDQSKPFSPEKQTKFIGNQLEQP